MVKGASFTFDQEVRSSNPLAIFSFGDEKEVRKYSIERDHKCNRNVERHKLLLRDLVPHLDVFFQL